MHNNTNYDWLVFTDQDDFEDYRNVKVYKWCFYDFKKLAKSKLVLDFDIKIPYKICDYRPAFGKIFEDYLIDYDYWGFVDLDVIFGDLDAYYRDVLEEYEYDVITCITNRIAGCFTILKNNEKVNNNFLHIKNYFYLLKSEKRKGLDDSAEHFYKSLLQEKLEIYNVSLLDKDMHKRFNCVLTENGKLLSTIDNTELLLIHIYKEYTNRFGILVEGNRIKTTL